MSKFTMPSLGADMASGTLLEWLAKPGDPVARGQVIAVVGTEKGDIEVEVWEDGILETQVAAPGSEVPVGAVLAHIRVAGEEAPLPAPGPAVAVEAAHAVVIEEPARHRPTPPQTNGHRIRVSPLARRLAQEMGVDLATVHGTGPHGAISRADVEASVAPAGPPAIPPVPPTESSGAAAQTAPTAPVDTVPADTPPARQPAKKGADGFQISMRKAIAAAMARANRDIPHYYLETRIDMTNSLAWLEAENLKRSIKERILPAVLLIKAVALGLAKVPQLNGFWMDDRFQPAEGIHIGFAIALRQGGLITPAIHHADLLNADDLMAALRDLIMRTRAGRLRSSELTDSTVTLTSLGDMGVEKVFGVIYPPQVALVGFGKIADDVWVKDGMLGVRPVVHATLAGDHRATDGRVGAEFLDGLTRLLQEPDTLWHE